MQTSRERILTTHIGSLPRSKPLLDMLFKIESGEPVDPAAFRAQVAADMDEIVRKQAETGIDVAGDGELPRIGFSFYVKDRMAGFAGAAKRGTVTDFAKFPGYAAHKMAVMQATLGEKGKMGRSASIYGTPECQSEVAYDPALTSAKEEIGLFGESLERTGLRSKFAETFVTAATPGIISTTLLRMEGHPTYASDRDYVFALARSLKKEYDYIVSQGHILQLDAPDLALERQIMFVDRPEREFLARVAMHIEALNTALADIPPEKVRLHVCWGNWDGPHLDDIELEPLLPLLYRAKVGALSLACANPRHQHDWKLYKRYPLPEGMAIVPGVIDVTTNYLEHPEVVADRLCQYVEAVGDRTRVIAGADCGFSTFAGYVMVPADVAWKKLEMLTSGAALASQRLWG